MWGDGSVNQLSDPEARTSGDGSSDARDTHHAQHVAE